MKTKYFPVSIMALFLVTGCVKEDELKLPFAGFEPKEIGDGWVISSPSAEGMDSLGLVRVYQDVYSDEDTWMMKSLLVFRHGKLVAESYLKNDIDITKPAAIWSCTKQVTGIITGIAIAERFIGNVNDSVGTYLPEYITRYPEKQSMTLQHLLTMTSGLDFDNGTQSDIFRQHKTDNSLDYVLGLDLEFPIGSRYHYKDGDPQVVSGIIQHATGIPLDEYGKQVLFDPLNITNYEWVRYSDGVTLGCWGILTTPRELAKIGECVLDSGRYDNQQIIPSNWWNEMLSPHIENAHEDAAFGYFWWSIPGKGWYFMWGHGGQFVFLHPQKHLMVVVTSLEQVDDDVALSYTQIVAIAEQVLATIK